MGTDLGALPVGQAWLKELIEQLDAALPEDPKQRTAGHLVVRALVRQAVKGDTSAIRECFRLAERQRPAVVPLPTRRRGRPRTRIDAAEIERLARFGMRDLSKIARCLGIPKQTLMGPKHGPVAKEAFERGRSLFELDALREHADDVASNRRNPLVMFKLRQCGWDDKNEGGLPVASASAALENHTDEELVEILRSTLKSWDEAAAEARTSADPAPSTLPGVK